MKVKAVDVFICCPTIPKLENLAHWQCTDIFTRGTRVGPDGKVSCQLTDVFQCRFSLSSQASTDTAHAIELLSLLNEKKFLWSNVHLIWAD